MHQGINEDPSTFATRIQHCIDLAEYNEGVNEQIMESTFLNGLHPEVSLAVRSTPTILSPAEKVGYAQWYWTARRPAGGMQTIQQALTPDLQQTIGNAYLQHQNLSNSQPAPSQTVTRLQANQQNQNQWNLRPATVDWKNADISKDTAINKLTE